MERDMEMHSILDHSVLASSIYSSRHQLPFQDLHNHPIHSGSAAYFVPVPGDQDFLDQMFSNTSSFQWADLNSTD
ncbi:hypothetical protein SAY86_013622 [Trapa natans]|uniref:Uncharacterized protein n=1 Tax=Trapa natans TaxID=22666 RepID=A0AAN7KZI7_TRANT|nr:hypothetical protein SAY86_013622 [Trapa natans]